MKKLAPIITVALFISLNTHSQGNNIVIHYYHLWSQPSPYPIPKDFIGYNTANSFYKGWNDDINYYGSIIDCGLASSYFPGGSLSRLWHYCTDCSGANPIIKKAYGIDYSESQVVEHCTTYPSDCASPIPGYCSLSGDILKCNYCQDYKYYAGINGGNESFFKNNIELQSIFDGYGAGYSAAVSLNVYNQTMEEIDKAVGDAWSDYQIEFHAYVLSTEIQGDAENSYFNNITTTSDRADKYLGHMPTCTNGLVWPAFESLWTDPNYPWPKILDLDDFDWNKSQSWNNTHNPGDWNKQVKYWYDHLPTNLASLDPPVERNGGTNWWWYPVNFDFTSNATYSDLGNYCDTGPHSGYDEILWDMDCYFNRFSEAADWYRTKYVDHMYPVQFGIKHTGSKYSPNCNIMGYANSWLNELFLMKNVLSMWKYNADKKKDFFKKAFFMAAVEQDAFDLVNVTYPNGNNHPAHFDRTTTFDAFANLKSTVGWCLYPDCKAYIDDGSGYLVDPDPRLQLYGVSPYNIHESYNIFIFNYSGITYNLTGLYDETSSLWGNYQTVYYKQIWVEDILLPINNILHILDKRDEIQSHASSINTNTALTIPGYSITILSNQSLKQENTYPSPATNVKIFYNKDMNDLNLNWNSTNTVISGIQIMNCLGQQVYARTLDLNGEEGHLNIKLPKVAPGLYVVSVKTNAGLVNEKIIVLK